MKKFIASLLSLVLFMVPPSSHAAYAQLKPPVGWAQGMGAAVPGQAGTFNYGAAANGATYKGTTVLTNAGLAVAGQLVTVPVSMRLAANAATVAATYSFGNPWLFGALTVGSLAYNYYKDSGYAVENGVWMKKTTEKVCNGPCTLYSLQNLSPTWYGSVAEMGPAIAKARSNAYATVTFKGCDSELSGAICRFSQVDPNYPNSTPVLTTATLSLQAQPSTLVTSNNPATKSDFETVLGAKALPIGLPEKLNVPLPLMPPVFNPDPAIDPQPAPAPYQTPRPMWIPTGDPVLQPNPSPTTQPDVWKQPGVRVTPSPTESDPWRVDLVPEEKSKNDPSPNPSGSTSTTTKPEPVELKTCGLPDTPACKIDETGMPEQSAIDSKMDSKKATDVYKEIQDMAANPAAKLPVHPVINWSFSLPTGCAMLPLPAFEPFIKPLDICQFRPMFHDVMNIVWLFGGIFGAISLFMKNALSH